MSIDHRDILPDYRIETVRYVPQGNRQHCRLILGHRAIVVIHLPALGIQNLNTTEAWRNPLTEPEGYPGQGLLQHCIRLGDSPQEVRMRIHGLCWQPEQCHKS